MAHSTAPFSVATWAAKARCSANVVNFVAAAAMTNHQHRALLLPAIIRASELQLCVVALVFNVRVLSLKVPLAGSLTTHDDVTTLCSVSVLLRRENSPISNLIRVVSTLHSRLDLSATSRCDSSSAFYLKGQRYNLLVSCAVVNSMGVCYQNVYRCQLNTTL